MKKKLVALLLCLVMALSLIPTTAWAAGGGWYNGECYHQLSKTSGTFYVGQYFGMYAGVYGLADGVGTAGPVSIETKPAPTDEPDAPTWNDLKNMTGLVNMVCETVNSHSRTYGLLEDTYTVSEVAKNADDVYTCTVTIINDSGVSEYIAKYNDDTNSKHEAGDKANDLTITL